MSIGITTASDFASFVTWELYILANNNLNHTDVYSILDPHLLLFVKQGVPLHI